MDDEVTEVVRLILEHARTAAGGVARGDRARHQARGAGGHGPARRAGCGPGRRPRPRHRIRCQLALREDVESFFAEDAPEPFFVKNLERVQGDERDAIILSVGYGKHADGRMRYQWGPLLRDGGERRLNVAATRAKHRLTVVSSFSATTWTRGG